MSAPRSLLILALVSACTAPAPDPVDEPIEQVSERGSLTLSIEGARATVAAGDVVAIEATLETAEPVTIWGSGDGLIGFGVTRLEDGLTVEPGFRLDCTSYGLAPGEPMVQPFVKSGGWSPDDPNAAFLRTYFGERVLRLPQGTWRIEATVFGSMGDCGGEAIELAAALEIVVTD